MGNTINVGDIWAERDVYGMEQWAQQYGMQKADGVDLYALGSANEYGVMTNSGVSAGQSVIYVPADIVINSASAGQEFGMSMQEAENAVVTIDQNAGYDSAQYRLPLLRLMVKILVEWEKGTDSLYYSWLNSVPRQFYNGVSVFFLPYSWGFYFAQLSNRPLDILFICTILTNL